MNIYVNIQKWAGKFSITKGTGRAFFCTISDQKIVILHTFIKKTQKTPKKELDIARRRMNDVKANW
ncbi:MAG TPA: type II toxin-antitoxin system RelE/ParE family toxin [Anaerolineae bacterium]|nr:type II toxin-antitoxin system RelE/ParE family toxin [Anaerolineae bacterium]